MFRKYVYLILRRSIATAWRKLDGWRLIAVPTVLFVAGLGLHKLVVGEWPILEATAGRPTAEVAIYLLYILVPTLIAFLICSMSLLVYTPYLVYREQQDRIAELVPDGTLDANIHLSRYESTFFGSSSWPQRVF